MFVQIVIGVIYASLVEWLVHNYILHGLGKRKNSVWSFHWHEHHHNSRKYNFVDASYLQPFYSGSRFKEILGLLALALAQSWLLLWLPWFVFTTWTYCAVYLWAHRKSHLEPEWCKKYLPWHFDHHCGKNQDSNWGVVLPLWDYILRTRKKI